MSQTEDDLAITDFHHELYAALGMCACLAPFLPTPYVSMVLCIEMGPAIGRAELWGGRTRMHTMVLMFVSVTASFAAYYAVMPRPYLNVAAILLAVVEAKNATAYDFAIGIAFGVVGAALALCYALVGGAVQVT